MRNKQEIGEMADELLNAIVHPPSDYDTDVRKRYGHYFNCLLWVLGKSDTEDFIEGLPLDTVEEVNQVIEETKGTEPDYIGDGIAVWQNVDENEDEYMIVLLFRRNGIRVNCFPPK